MYWTNLSKQTTLKYIQSNKKSFGGVFSKAHWSSGCEAFIHSMFLWVEKKKKGLEVWMNGHITYMLFVLIVTTNGRNLHCQGFVLVNHFSNTRSLINFKENVKEGYVNERYPSIISYVCAIYCRLVTVRVLSRCRHRQHMKKKIFMIWIHLLRIETDCFNINRSHGYNMYSM